MPRQRVRIEVEGIDELVAKFGKRSLIDDPMLQLMEDATKAGQKGAVNAVDGGMGIAVRSINRNVGLTSKGSTVTTAMSTQAIRSIDLGRKRNQEWQPLVKSMYKWTRAVGSTVNPFRLAHQIAKSGTKGKRFKAAGLKAVEDVMPDLRREMERRIEAGWKR